MSTLDHRNTIDYDFIIAGAGCAGLSLLIRILQSPSLQHKNILLVDKAPKKSNDRTWCFWETKPDIFESIVKYRWDKVLFASPDFSSTIQLQPFQYKMIEGLDFYNYCFDVIEKYSNVSVVYAEISKIYNEKRTAAVALTDGKTYTGKFVFNSIPSFADFIYQPTSNPAVPGMLQHFKGWVIETDAPAFNPSVATFMDFKVDQSNGTTFVYVMPMSANKALVEYTLFTPQLLHAEAYNKALHAYIQKHLGINNYKIQHEEFGVIPMTSLRFPTHDDNIIFIGTAGGKVKASSGYAFRFIQRHSQQIVSRLEQNQFPAAPATFNDKKFFLYDRVLLRVLLEGKLQGADIFSIIFKRNTPATIFRFLDNSSSLFDDLKIMSSVPTATFLPAAVNEMMRK